MEKTPYIPLTWNLPDSIRKRLGKTVGKQRLMNEDGHLLLLLHRAPRAEEDEIRQPMVVWRSPEGEWKSTPISGGLSGLDAHIATYRTAIHQADNDVESAKTPRQFFEVMHLVNPLQRATRHLSEVLQATRQALPDETRIINLRDQAAELERAIDLVASDAKSGMDFTLAEAANQQAISAEAANHEARRLNRLAAFFFPLATLVAVFGMNPPERIYQNTSFWIVLGAGILLGAIVYTMVGAKSRDKDRK
jgi:hypothetical protein